MRQTEGHKMTAYTILYLSATKLSFKYEKCMHIVHKNLNIQTITITTRLQGKLVPKSLKQSITVITTYWVTSFY